MAWWDREELKDPACRSDRYIVTFPEEYSSQIVRVAQRNIDLSKGLIKHIDRFAHATQRLVEIPRID